MKLICNLLCYILYIFMFIYIVFLLFDMFFILFTSRQEQYDKTEVIVSEENISRDNLCLLVNVTMVRDGIIICPCFGLRRYQHNCLFFASFFTAGTMSSVAAFTICFNMPFMAAALSAFT